MTREKVLGQCSRACAGGMGASTPGGGQLWAGAQVTHLLARWLIGGRMW